MYMLELEIQKSLSKRVFAIEKNTTKLLFAMLSSALFGKRLTQGERELCTDEEIKNVLSLAKKHDIAHFIKVALDKEGFIQGEEDYSVLSEFATAVYRDEARERSYDELCRLLAQMKVPFIPLKGSVMNRLYPEAWMRTSSDIDILIHQSDIKRATELLTQEHHYKFFLENILDVSLFSPYGTHIELHHSLASESKNPRYCDVLKEVWDFAAPLQGNPYLYEMSDDMFYFYHVSHMACHFEAGGCGIKPFLDLYLLDKLQGIDVNAREELLSRGGLLTFARTAQKLYGVWFDSEGHTDTTKMMESYILYGGVYGTTLNRMMVQQTKRGSKAKFILSRLFLPYEYLKVRYPIIAKHKWLTPFCQAARWTKLFSPQSRRRAKYEFDRSRNMSKEATKQVSAFLEELGL